MSQVFLGQVILMANNYAPRNFHICDGTLLGIPQYNALYSLLGTSFGGNGTTNFAIPDLRSRVPLGTGAGPGLSNYTLGQNGGTETMTLTAQNVAPHTHTGSLTVSPGGGRSAPVPPAAGNYLQATETFPPSLAPSPVALGGVSVNPNSGGTPFSILQPYLAMSYYIALLGIYPSRN